MSCNQPNSGCGFQAFDGSNRWFKRLGIYDVDCCYLSTDVSSPDDGYYILEKRNDLCGCCRTQAGMCVVVESVRWYATNRSGAVGPAGSVVACPSFSCRLPGRSATWCSLEVNPGCCNADGSKIYAELTDEISPLP